MHARRPFSACALVAALVLVWVAAGCLGKKSRTDVQYYRTIGRGTDGLRRGEGLITSKQARTQEHWRAETTDGRLVKLAHYNDSGGLIEEIRIAYDADGVVSEENTHDAGGRLVESLAFEYDDRGRLAGYARRTAAAGQRRWTYDEQGRLDELRAVGPRGMPLWRDEFVYVPDHPNKLLGARRYDPDNKPIREIPASDYSFWE
jgi:YD repeat-containing protein